MRIAIQSESTDHHPHPNLRGHVLWAVFLLMILVLLFSRSVTSETMFTTSGTIGAEPERFLGQEGDLTNAVIVPTPALNAVQDSERVSVTGTVRIYKVIVASPVVTAGGAQLVIR